MTLFSLFQIFFKFSISVNNKLIVLAAYPFLTVISISVASCNMRICGSLVWALTKGASDREGHLTGGRCRGHLSWG